MKTIQYTVKDPLGLHARPAGELVKLLKSYQSGITIEKAEKAVSATKLLAVMGLGVKQGDQVTFTLDGEDEEAAAEALQRFLEEKL